MDFSFEVQGTENIYTIQVSFNNEQTICLCNCKAGSIGQMCKHKLGVLLGKKENVLTNQGVLNNVKEQFLQSNAYKTYQHLLQLEANEASIKAQIIKTKKQFAKEINS